MKNFEVFLDNNEVNSEEIIIFYGTKYDDFIVFTETTDPQIMIGIKLGAKELRIEVDIYTIK